MSATRIDMQNANPNDLSAILYSFYNFPTAKQPQRAKTAKIRERGEGDPIAACWPGCF
jgi:hypothetical protein